MTSKVNDTANSNKDIQQGNNILPGMRIQFPEGGGAYRGLDEKLQVNPLTGTCSFGISLPFCLNRHDYLPNVSVSYNSSGGNSLLGLGWELVLPSITRRTDKQLPRYQDEEESDTFILDGYDDLVLSLEMNDIGEWTANKSIKEKYTVKRYKTAIEKDFLKIEKYEHNQESYWKVTNVQNQVTYYGLNDYGRISDPNNSSRIFKWLPQVSFDNLGNIIVYEYIGEEDMKTYGAMKYLKRIIYGNKVPFIPSEHDYIFPSVPDDMDYFYHVLFDYGDHDMDVPQYEPDKSWLTRCDPISNYRSGFNLGINRLLKRVLFFNHFDENPHLTKSVDFSYQYSNTNDEIVLCEADFIKQITYSSYKKNTDGVYMKESFPPLTFEYSEPDYLNNDILKSTVKLKEPLVEGWFFYDYYNEGIPGIVNTYNDEIYYRNNLGDGKFGESKPITEFPTLKGINEGVVRLSELDPKGKKVLVSFKKEHPGFYEEDNDKNWSVFRPFKSVPNIDFEGEDTFQLDLDGDGLSEIMIMNDGDICYYPSLGKEGFDTSVKGLFIDSVNNNNPILINKGKEKNIYLADMNGDGLTDIVKITNGEVSYWPNLGYGHFGKEVIFTNSPRFSGQDCFDVSKIILSDITGTGACDLIYTGNGKVEAWVNYSGHTFGEEITIETDTYGSNKWKTCDIYGQGTSVLINYENSRNIFHCIDLCGRQKPYLLKKYSNSMGKEVEIEYKSSVKDYLEDKKQGVTLVTNLPFPVQCVERITTKDLITDLKLTTHYKYRHGYYDGYDREFRGFGMVEQWDAEYDDSDLCQHPTMTRTWNHTGAYFEEKDILICYKDEFFRNSSEFSEQDLKGYHIELNNNIQKTTTYEHKDAIRALKGSVLRKETYFMDGSEQEENPVEVVAVNTQIKMLQPSLQKGRAVYNRVEKDIIHYTYERDIAHPRVIEQQNLVFNPFGQIELSCVISWGKPPESELPNDCVKYATKKHILFQQNKYTNSFDMNNCYRLPGHKSLQKWEVCDDSLENYTSSDILVELFNSARIINYYETGDTTEAFKKKVSEERIAYYDDNLQDILPIGEIGKKAIRYRNYILAYTSDQPFALYDGEIETNDLINAGYIYEDECWWIAGEKLLFNENPQATFYLPIGLEDVFGNMTKVSYYNDYYIFIGEVEDVFGGKTRISEYDFGIMQPTRIIDINNNIEEARYDILGRLVGKSQMGKGEEGDNFDGFEDMLSTIDIDNFFSDPYNQSNNALKGATERYIYDFNSVPIKVALLKREQHHSIDENAKIKININYYDGLGRIMINKNLSETIHIGSQRWLTNEMHIYNNKGKPVKTFNPYFSNTHIFEVDEGFQDIGVPTTYLYDSIGRPIKTIFPDGTFEKTNIHPWYVELYDRNDTAYESSWYDERIHGALSTNTQENRAAQKTEIHYNTPAIQYLDARGKNIYTINHLKKEIGDTTIQSNRFNNDILGRVCSIYDTYNRESEIYIFDLAGRQISLQTIDSGCKKQFYDALGRILYSEDAREIKTKYTYDAMSRLTEIKVLTPTESSWKTVQKNEYGDMISSAELNNLRNQLVKCYDHTGVLHNKVFDFKGNPISFSRTLCVRSEKEPDWSGEVSLEEKEYEFTKTYNVMNQPLVSTLPNGSQIIREYNINGQIKAIGHKTDAGTQQQSVTDIQYNEKGQKLEIQYNNGIHTTYTYDALTYRLTRILSRRTVAGNERTLQDIRYVYDPVGNITYTRDEAGKTVIFNGSVAEPECEYTYDSLYRLIRTTGREHNGLNQPNDETDMIRTIRPHPNDGTCMLPYTENYQYDLNGNITEIRHVGGSSIYSWTRTLENQVDTNRLNTETIGSEMKTFDYDTTGNITRMNHLSSLVWDYRGLLIETDSSSYWYDVGGHRTRKVTTYGNGTTKERIYFGEYEIFRQYAADTLIKERETILLFDKDMTFVETDLEKEGINYDRLSRYRLQNHLNSSCMEINEDGEVISYEEYYAFGGTSLHSIKSLGIEAKISRYRYCGKERDEETGLYYYGLRYYAPWLGKWLSPDPAGAQEGLNPYVYGKNNPIRYNDPSGATDEDNTEQRENDTNNNENNNNNKREKVSVLGTIFGSTKLFKAASLLVLGIINGDDWKKITGKVAGLIKDIWDFLGYISDEIHEWQESTLTSLKDWAKENILEPVKNFFKNVWEKIKNFFSKVWSGIKSLFGGSENDSESSGEQSGDQSENSNNEEESSWFDDVKDFFKDHFSFELDGLGLALKFNAGDYEVAFSASTDGLKLKGNMKGYKFEYGVDFKFEKLKYSYGGKFGERKGEIKFKNEVNKSKDFNTPFYWLNHTRDTGVRALRGFAYNY